MILRQREKSSVESSSKYLLKKQESLRELSSWHREQSGRISCESEEGIKAHHNAGGLPEDMAFELVEPVRILFQG